MQCPRCGNKYVINDFVGGTHICNRCYQRWHMCVARNNQIQLLNGMQKHRCPLCEALTSARGKKQKQPLRIGVFEDIPDVNICPKCGSTIISICDCEQSDRSCSQCGISWHVCPVMSKTILFSGQGHYECSHCNKPPEEESEFESSIFTFEY